MEGNNEYDALRRIWKRREKKHTRTHHITFSSWSTLVFKFFFSLSHFYLPKLKHPYKLSPQALEKKTLSDECMHVFIFFTVWSLTFLNHRRWWMEILTNTNGKGQKMKKSHNCFFFGLGKYELNRCYCEWRKYFIVLFSDT